MSNLLEGAYDLHFHPSPDVVKRKLDDIELMEDWTSAGMNGGVIKGHYADTTGRALDMRKLYPKLRVYGGLVLNGQAGGINPDAVERMAEAGGKFLWFPTMDALAYRKRREKGNSDADFSSYISVCDADGKLYDQVYDVLDMAARYDLILGTGHLGEEEGMLIVKAAFERGVKRVVLTHAENPNTPFSIANQQECVRMGAVVEHCCFTLYANRVSWDEVVDQIHSVGANNCFLVTDFGQPNSPTSSEGLRIFADKLMDYGIKESEIEIMIKEIPKQLLS